MRIGRAIIIPVILALGTAGSALTGAGVIVGTAAVPSAQVRVGTSSSGPNMLYHGVPNMLYHGVPNMLYHG